MGLLWLDNEHFDRAIPPTLEMTRNSLGVQEQSMS